ncbi:alpha/beta hydrolase [Aquibacillus kalidii]|uniref:alpha/beta hydrolase n=1 Tax=Aquibacillus kalidii TaxID=2762597 RepID=UPI002E29A5F9|nr:alpha/beta hydrolase-fold protein [Aquibacillus kalidii]
MCRQLPKRTGSKYDKIGWKEKVEVLNVKRKGKMLDTEIHSSYLNEVITIKWYQPEAFTPMMKYQICLMQDGNDYFQLGRIATLSDQLHDEAEIEPTIFVGIHYNDKNDRQNKYHPNGSKQSAYIQFLLKEVIPFLDSELPTHQMASSRTIMGDSLAGTLAFMTALQFPHTFGKVIMQSPYVDQKVMNLLADSHNLESLSIYHTIGNEETDVRTTSGVVQDFLTPNRLLADQLHDRNCEYTYHEFDGHHSWKYWQPDLPRALRLMLS